MNIEKATEELAIIRQKIESGELKPPTLESLGEQLEKGEITQAQYDHKVEHWCLTPEARSRYREEVIRMKLEPKFGPVPSWER